MNLQPIADFIRYLRFTDGLSSSDVIGWILAALAGIIAYRLIDNMQMSIERHTMLSTIEDAVSSLYDSQIAFSVPKGQTLSEDNADASRVMVRAVLLDICNLTAHIEMPVSVQISNIRIAVWGLDIFFFLDNNS